MSLSALITQKRPGRVYGGAVPRSQIVALVGNPNSGKTTLFNAMTGLRQKVGNYPGVTVEKKEGRVEIPLRGFITLIDLPGTYSLQSHSPDEQITADVLVGRSQLAQALDSVICVVDAGNLERSLYLVSQILDRGLRVVISLNMIDTAGKKGITIDIPRLARSLGVPVIPTIASRGVGIDRLKEAVAAVHPPFLPRQWQLPGPVERECLELADLLRADLRLSDPDAFSEAITLLAGETARVDSLKRYSPELREHIKKDHKKLDFLGFDRSSLFVEARYTWIRGLCHDALRISPPEGIPLTDRVDRIVTHRVWGLLIFLGLMGLMFQSIFTWASLPMALIAAGFDALSAFVSRVIPPGELQDLIIRGALAGVSAVVTFIPQIVLLFFFIGILEDSGYMARAAFLMNRTMGRVGLHGKSFLPLLSSFACAIPGIMAARTIEHPRDRLTTMLVAPMMSCSARLPVYTLLIAAFIPTTPVFGFLSPAGIVLFSLYSLGLFAALGMAWVLKRSILKAPSPPFLMELPEYRLPSLQSVFLQVWERALSFLRRAGTIILGASILLWFLATYPKMDHGTPAERLRHSFAGQAGQMLEPMIRPLGFDWKIGIGLVSSLLQREMFVSTMVTIYNVDNVDHPSGSVTLRDRMREERDPATGRPTFTIVTALSLMVYYLFAMQCLSTVSVMRRETNGWKWPIFQIAYMSALAYAATYLVYHIGSFLLPGA